MKLTTALFILNVLMFLALAFIVLSQIKQSSSLSEQSSLLLEINAQTSRMEFED